MYIYATPITIHFQIHTVKIFIKNVRINLKILNDNYFTWIYRYIFFYLKTLKLILLLNTFLHLLLTALVIKRILMYNKICFDTQFRSKV